MGSTLHSSCHVQRLCKSLVNPRAKGQSLLIVCACMSRWPCLRTHKWRPEVKCLYHSAPHIKKYVGAGEMSQWLKITGCSSSEARSNAQHPHGRSQLSVIPILGDSTFPYRHICRPDTNACEIKIKFKTCSFTFIYLFCDRG